MSIIIFLLLPMFVFNFYVIGFKAESAELAYFLRPNKTEYLIIYSSGFLSSYYASYIIRVNSKTGKHISTTQISNDGILSFKKLPNNITIYTFSTFVNIINK